MPGIIIDIGTGDGKFAYELAKRYPDRFVIAIDPAQRGLEKVSHKAGRKPAKGGLPNALFVLANVEDLPAELDGVADQVFINFPWSGLLRAVVLVDERAWSGIRRICKPGAIVDAVFGYDKESDPGTAGLPELDQDHVMTTMVPKLRDLGFAFVDAHEVSVDDLKDFPSSWAQALRFGQKRTYHYLRLRAS